MFSMDGSATLVQKRTEKIGQAYSMLQKAIGKEASETIQSLHTIGQY